MAVMMVGRLISTLLVGLLLLETISAFQPLSIRRQRAFFLSHADPIDITHRWISRTSTTTTGSSSQSSTLFAVDKDREEPHKQSRVRKLIRKIRNAPQLVKKVVKRPLSLGIAIVLASAMIKPAPVQASAPVMALPKAEGRDPTSEALLEHDRSVMRKTQQDLDDFARKAREIEATKGEAARFKFEKEYKEQQLEEAAKKKEGLIELKRKLLEQGIDPSIDIEGQRQITLYEKGVDLGEVPGTPFYLEKEFERTAYKRSNAYKTEANRKIIACMVQDMKNRDVDYVEYFDRHTDQTAAILDLKAAKANALLAQYEENLEKYGQITVPKEGEMSALEKMAAKEKERAANDPAARKAAKAEARRLEKERKAEEKAKAKALKLQEREEKAKAKAEAKAAEKQAKEAKKAEAAAAAATAAGTAVEEAAGAAADEVIAEDEAALSGELIIEGEEEEGSATAAPQVARKKIPIIPVSAAVLAAGGGTYAFKVYREKAAREEEERQEQFRLLMGQAEGKTDGESSATTAPALEEIDVDLSAVDEKDEASKTKETAAPETDAEKEASAPKKRRLGIKRVFGKKKSDRETNLNVLVSDDAMAPEFAKLLAKILTFGAPGRFPTVIALPGDMPMEEFDLEAAKEMLIESRTAADLELEQSAEIFANVVNCMLIDIVDLASSSLKEKDDKATVDAINIVVDFMNHAASLYDSVAEGLSITPVTYGGDLGKAKLEQMYSAYAVSGMVDMEKITDDFDSRVALLQDVFQINEKKAQGLMMKAMQKNMMKMLKSGEGMEGMEEMMKGMGGMPGMEGGEPDTEQLKEMLSSLKEMKDSGAIPPDEFEEVKQKFKKAFGSSIDDVVKEAGANEEEMSQTDKELLDLMKSIMED